jgi:hypothetical protein
MLGGSIENTPGAEKTSMKDSEGTIRQDSDAGKKAKSCERTATGSSLTVRECFFANSGNVPPAPAPYRATRVRFRMRN